MFLLDTNAVIDAMSRKRRQVADRLDFEVSAGTSILISTIVLHELRVGVLKSDDPVGRGARLAHFLMAPIEIVAFDIEDAMEASEIRADLERRGMRIGAYDTLIAAQARRRGAAVVTRNLREYLRVTGLVTTDWSIVG